MSLVSDDSSWQPSISSYEFLSYWLVAAGAVVAYDWVLTLGQEIELIWASHRVPYYEEEYNAMNSRQKQRWSLMTVLYLVTRYTGVPYSVIRVLAFTPLISLTDAECNIMYYALNGTNSVVFTMLGVIMIARLHAMYQRSRVILIFFVIIFLAIMIACVVFMAIGLKDIIGEEELILSGTYVCSYRYKGDFQLLFTLLWMLSIVWEVLALCFSVWIAVKHFHGLRRLGPSTGSTIGDCFRVLIKSHVLYFASFVCICCTQLGSFSPELFSSNAIGELTLDGALQILLCIEMFVLGPRLILSVREYHAKLVANSDAETSMTSITFQERIDVPTSSTV